MFKALIAAATLVFAVQSHAVGVRLTKPVKSEIQEKAVNLLRKVEKAYKCTLEGRYPQGWALSSEVSIRVTAASLENAAELALTPYVVEQPTKDSMVVKIKVENHDFLVQKINCQPEQQDI